MKKDDMSNFKRHLMKGAARTDDDGQYLRYWWCGEDELVKSSNGALWWYDRLQRKGFKGMERQHVGNAIVLNRDYMMCYSTLSFGRRFRIVFDAKATVLADSMKQQITFADFNSITNSHKGFCCALSQVAKSPSMNYKMFGNDKTALYFFPQDSFPFEKGETIDGIFEFGNEAYDDNKDILWFRFNGGKKIYSNNPHKAISHDDIGSNESSRIRLNAAVEGPAYGDVRYTQNITYRNIKIYVYE